MREPALEEDSCEAVWCKIHVSGFCPLYNCWFNRKPDHHPELVFSLDNAISKVTSSSCVPNILITGDFNLPHINWDLHDNENKYPMQDNPQYGPTIAHLHDDVTHPVHYGCSSKESLKMASGSCKAGGFSCCVPGCYNNLKKRKGKFSFYNLPHDQNLRQWFHNISRKDFHPTTGHRVCSAHFEGGSKTYQTRCQLYFLYRSLTLKW